MFSQIKVQTSIYAVAFDLVKYRLPKFSRKGKQAQSFLQENKFLVT